MLFKIGTILSGCFQIDISKAIELRDSIVFSGQDIHRPMNVARRMSEFNSDKDVNRSLMTMLLSPTEVVS